MKKKTFDFYTFDNEKSAKNTLDSVPGKKTFTMWLLSSSLRKHFTHFVSGFIFEFRTHITFSTKAFAYSTAGWDTDEKLWFLRWKFTITISRKWEKHYFHFQLKNSQYQTNIESVAQFSLGSVNICCGWKRERKSEASKQNFARKQIFCGCMSA